MSRTIKIVLTPLEPYFFGSDRTFHYGEEDRRRVGESKYFISSEILPLQTTLFGVLRYLGIEDKNSGYRIDDAVIGKESFKYSRGAGQSFGMIERISMLYLQRTIKTKDREEKLLYVRAPRDHKKENEALTNKEIPYKPFNDYRDVETSEGRKLIPLDYDAKEGLFDGFISVSTHKLIETFSVFNSTVKTGIDINKEKNAYYKMSYIRMEPDWSFVFWATVKEGFPTIKDKIVYMGARKSTFFVTVSEEPEPGISLQGMDKGKEGFNIGKIYLLSDTYIEEEGLNILRERCVHINIDVRTAREYVTNYHSSTQKDRFTKGNGLYRLIKAGGILLYKRVDEETIKNNIKNEHMEVIGCNHYVTGGL